jgi:putative addiction module component (TIGR02574 family)
VKLRISSGAALGLSGAATAIVCGRHRPLLGVSFLVTVGAALAVNGMRRTLASLHIPLSDADDRLSPAAVARTIRHVMMGNLVFLSVMSGLYAIVAGRSGAVVTKVFSTAFSVAALCAGPLTSLRRSVALWAAVCVLLAAILTVVIWDRIAANESQVPVPDWHREVLHQRLADYQANPDQGRPWEEVEADLLK